MLSGAQKGAKIRRKKGARPGDEQKCPFRPGGGMLEEGKGNRHAVRGFRRLLFYCLVRPFYLFSYNLIPPG